MAPPRFLGIDLGTTNSAAAVFDGATLAFVDYVMELPYFCTEVIPRLERKGLRIPLAK